MNADGSCDLRTLIVWALGRGNEHLPDTVVEILALCVDTLYPPTDALLIILGHRLRDLQTRHGQDVAAALGQLLIDSWVGATQHDEPLDDEHWRHRETELRETYIPRVAAEIIETERAESDLKFVVTCDECGKLRRGRTWSSGKIPAGYERRPGLCPSCARLSVIAAKHAAEIRGQQ
ncbi:MAG TPA: hypothetical protein VGN12_20060 [Pirellulales bacterium]